MSRVHLEMESTEVSNGQISTTKVEAMTNLKAWPTNNAQTSIEVHG